MKNCEINVYSRLSVDERGLVHATCYFRSQTVSASPPIIPFNRDYVLKICFLLLEVLAISSEKKLSPN